ncbi:MAG: hypothetical protein WCI73_00120 [Phycisphaerae bacterium]
MVASNSNKSQARFRLGQIVATPGALAALDEAGQNPLIFLARHMTGDWGDLDTHDQRANNEACAHEGDTSRPMRILSAYRTAKGVKILVITEFDRSVTTLLRPEEY